MGKINEIVSNFIAINDLANNEDILAILLYGSYAYETNTSNSDVDLLLIISGKNNYRISKMFEGINFDIHALSIPEMERNIVYEKANGNQFISSVLKNSLIFENKYNTLEYLKCISDVSLRGCTRVINSEFLNLAISAVKDFLECEDNDDFKYYVALDLLRNVIHVKLNASFIPETKVYKLYSDNKYAREKYLVKLPNKEFIDLYMDALKMKKADDRKSLIKKMLEYLGNIKVDEDAVVNDKFYDDDAIKKILVTLNHLVITTEDNIMNSTPYANALYFLTLNKIMNTIKCAFGSVPEFGEEIFKRALNEKDENGRIQVIEELFHVVDCKYKIDYDDFVLKL